MFTQVVIIGLVNTIWGVPTTLIVVVSSQEFLLKFLPIETPLNPQPKFTIDPISIPPLTKFVLGATIVSNLVVGIIKLSG